MGVVIVEDRDNGRGRAPLVDQRLKPNGMGRLMGWMTWLLFVAATAALAGGAAAHLWRTL